MKLDIGCGQYVKEGFIGIDNYPKDDKSILLMDATDLKFESDSIDEIYSRRCIQHIKDDNKAISEMYRVLKPNSKATVICASIFGWFYFNLGGKINSCKRYVIFNLYNKRILKEKFKSAGFNEVKIITCKFDYIVEVIK